MMQASTIGSPSLPVGDPVRIIGPPIPRRPGLVRGVGLSTDRPMGQAYGSRHCDVRVLSRAGNRDPAVLIPPLSLPRFAPCFDDHRATDRGEPDAPTPSPGNRPMSADDRTGSVRFD